MQVAIDLADAPHGVFTNLDFVQGHVLLKLPSTAPITSITAKLEGEAQTMIAPPPDEVTNRRERPVHELHKILYESQVVFPEKELPGSSHYTLPPGSYQYPFRFKIPFNTTCLSQEPRALPSFPQYIKHPPPINAPHTKAALPPTLGGFPGLASIRYYVKVTVNRKEFYKENPRQIHHISFLPIEPPRPSPSPIENYGRRTYQFPPETGGAPGKQPSLRKVFSGLKLNRSATGSSTASGVGSTLEQPPKIEVDARLPDPAILAATARVPLRILIKRHDEGTEPVYLQTLQVELVGQTKIRAGQWNREESTSWIITSHSNMNELLTFSTDTAATAANPSSPVATTPINEKGNQPQSSAQAPKTPTDSKLNTTSTAPAAQRPRQLVLDSSRWSTPLPTTIAPSFRVCNIARSYVLDVRLGIGHGPASARNQIILPLRLNVEVYSGIAPPPPLLAAVSAAHQRRPVVSKKPLSAQAQQNAAAAAKASAAAADSPAAGPSSSSAATAPGGVALSEAAGEEPPPSYEDAMAVQLPPVEGPRAYEPGPAPTGDDGFPRDQKRRPS